MLAVARHLATSPKHPNTWTGDLLHLSGAISAPQRCKKQAPFAML